MTDTLSEEPKQAALSYFDFVITKASIDQESGEKRWACVASDTGVDQLNDEMHKSLFDSFLHRIKANVEVPPPWQSEYWKGGTPYMSLSHYSDANGKAVPGEVQSVYLDGSLLKAKGRFTDTPLGEAAYKSVRESYQKVKSGAEGFQPVRISIGFLDYKHTHKASGYVFERKSFAEHCPECKKEFIAEIRGQARSGVIYQDGQLIHLALTRVPVNQRTMIGLDTEVVRSMGTMKQDAASIVGEELAEEIEEMDGEMDEEMRKKHPKSPKKSLVTKSEETPAVIQEAERYYSMAERVKVHPANTVTDIFSSLVETVWDIAQFGDYPTAESRKSAVRQAVNETSEMITVRGLSIMDGLNLNTTAPLVPEVKVEETPLDKAYAALKAKVESVDKSKAENMSELGAEYEAFASVIRSQFAVASPEAPKQETSDVGAVIERALAPLVAEIANLKGQIAARPTESGEVRRGITGIAPLIVVNDPKQNVAPVPTKKVSQFTQLANAGVGLDPNFTGRSGAKVAG